MVTKRLSALTQNPELVSRINRFLNSHYYVLFICLITTASNLFRLELAAYTVYCLSGILTCLFAYDLLPLMPIVLCSFLSTSSVNNPGSNPNPVFAMDRAGPCLIAMLLVAAACLVWRLWTDPQFGGKQFLTKKRSLLPGMLILAVGYALGGLFSPAFPSLTGKNALFSLLQLAVIALPYWVFSGAVNWQKAPKDYFAWICFGIGGVLLLELGWIYLDKPVVVNGMIQRDQIYTGWGMYNHIGGLLAMMIPYAFYLASRYRKGWIGAVVGSAFLIGVFLTCSRSSILFGCGAWLVCIILMLMSASNPKGNTLALVVTVLGVAFVVILFRNELFLLFQNLVDRGLDPNHRDEIYEAGLKQFTKYPIFGGSFYPIDYTPYDWSTVSAFSSFFPPRWHNTLVQLLASTGIVGTLCYGFHRVQTIRMFLRDRTREKAFIACSIAVLIGTSLLDCHIFNFYPMLFYSVSLAYAEFCIKPTKK